MRSFSSPLALAGVLAALAPASALGATGHWSSPVVVAPADQAFGASAAAFIAPDGRSLALTNSRAPSPFVAVGNAAGTFGAPVAISPGPSGTRTVDYDGALGADGRFAVAWATDDAVRIAVAGPGQIPGGHVDIPAAGVNSAAVAIAPDGAVSVAYRTKDKATGISSALVTSAAAGATSFSDPVTVDSGTAALTDVDIAAGPGGALAVSYRKSAPALKTTVAVKPAGASAFEAPQAVSASTTFDNNPQVVADSDGTFVVAWTNNATGAGYALRGPAASAFGAPLALSTEPTSTVDLAATGTGGAVASWAGNGVVRTAVQPAGGTFGEPVTVDTYTGNIPPQPAATVAPDATLTVVDNHAEDGSIQAIDVGGAATTIGYGAAGKLSPAWIASSADRTLALWVNADGAISAATRSATAPPSHGPGPKPGAPDRTAPKLTLLGGAAARRVTFRSVPKTIRVRVRCNEACLVSGQGSVRAQVGKRKSVSPLSPARAGKLTAGVQTVTFRLGTTTRKLLRSQAARGRGAQVFLVLEARDAAANAMRARVQVTLKPAKKATRRH
ncbi:MAG: hypothetical protein QOK49_1383 [Baekduia sp.]|nr:hypothetical protein [Baekduia sp.]